MNCWRTTSPSAGRTAGVLAAYLNLDVSDELYRAGSYVLAQNLVHGDALTMRTDDGQPISFAEWGYLGKGRFQRATPPRHPHPFGRFQREGSLFADVGRHEIFKPTKTYPPMTVRQLAAALGGAPQEAE